jgi:hypothetical protein
MVIRGDSELGVKLYFGSDVNFSHKRTMLRVL